MSQSTEYIILTLANYTTEQLAEIGEHCLSGPDSWRYNKDKTKSVAVTNSPSLLSNHTGYNHVEISKLMRTEEWIFDDLD